MKFFCVDMQEINQKSIWPLINVCTRENNKIFSTGDWLYLLLFWISTVVQNSYKSPSTFIFIGSVANIWCLPDAQRSCRLWERWDWNAAGALLLLLVPVWFYSHFSSVLEAFREMCFSSIFVGLSPTVPSASIRTTCSDWCSKETNVSPKE